MLARAREILKALSEPEQIAVINAHPRIGEGSDKMSALSFKEQGYDRDTTPPEVLRRLAALNEEYEQKFGFRFVVFVNRRSQEAIVPVLEARLRGTRDEERRTALREILAIAEDRLKRGVVCMFALIKLIQSLFGTLLSEGTPGHLRAGVVLGYCGGP